MRAFVSAWLIAGAFAQSALSQDAKKPPPTEFSADLGLVAVSGNTSVSTFNLNEKYTRRLERWTFKQEFGSVYGKTDGVESSNLVLGGLRADYSPAEHFALYALAAYDRNRFAGIKARFAEGAGVVWRIITTDVNQLNVESGYQLTQQQNLIGPDHNFSALRVASNWRHAFTKSSYFSEGVEYLPNIEDHEDYRVTSESAVVAPLSSHVGIKFSYIVRFANAPPLNATGTALLRKADRILSTGVQVTY
jgi:putative salt-induced outer membrane protein YdiY